MAKREYLQKMRIRYGAASGRVEKSRLLDEFHATTGYDRKYLIRFLAKSQRPGRKPTSRRGRKRRYEPQELLPHLRRIWKVADFPCSKRLKVMIRLWLPSYELEVGTLDDETREKLQSISPATLDRLLKPVRLKHGPRGLATTKPGALLRGEIPVQTGQWREDRPGFVEADTVAHCGGSMAGAFVFTVDCVDIATGWTEQRAIWSKGAQQVVKQMVAIESALPFPLRGFDSDNGSEFINEQLVRHFLSRREPVLFTRSRAYEKNDNAHIEQKNWTHVRQWIGYERIDQPEAVELLNRLYSNEWRLFHNLYCPSVKLISKERKGSKLIRKYDAPKTPYERVMESTHVSEYHKNGLAGLLENTNPFHLRRAIDAKLRKILKLCYNPPKGPRSEGAR